MNKRVKKIMETAVFNSESKEDLSKLISIANKMGISSNIVPSSEIEDFYLTQALKDGETGEYIPEEEIFREFK